MSYYIILFSVQIRCSACPNVADLAAVLVLLNHDSGGASTAVGTKQLAHGTRAAQNHPAPVRSLRVFLHRCGAKREVDPSPLHGPRGASAARVRLRCPGVPGGRALRRFRELRLAEPHWFPFMGYLSLVLAVQPRERPADAPAVLAPLSQARRRDPH